MNEAEMRTMKTKTDYLYFTTKNKKEIINITDQVREVVKKSGVKEGALDPGSWQSCAA